MSLTERDYIAWCKKQIEQKLRFENGNGSLKQRDLEYLSDVIEEKGGIRLSLSTLKRLWKNDYDQTPHPSTLQALVSVLGFKDWQQFKLQQLAALAPPPAPVAVPAPVIPAKKRLSNWMLLPVAAAGIIVIFWSITFNTHAPAKKKPIVKGPVVFTANKTVVRGVPNTVIFRYDVKNIEADSFSIQQSWNNLELTRIDPKGQYFSTMYYFPGFHRAKLIANDSIIVRQKIHITTDGWLPLVLYDRRDKIPVYLGRNDMISDGMLHITKANLAASKVDLNRPFGQSYFNVRDFDNTSSTNFVIDTRVRSDSIGNIPCPGVELTLLCEEHIFYVRLLSKGCARDIAVKMGEVYRDGSNNDLSSLGCNPYEWQHLQIKVINKQATIYLNDRPVYSTAFKEDLGRIVGLCYHFAGTGAIDFCRLGKNDSTWVYTEEFN